MKPYQTQDLPELLRQNSYPGRGIVLGTSADGTKSALAYFIMGRSDNSRNRIFTQTEDGIRTEAYDPQKLEDPSLIIYHPVCKVGETVVVTNGDQTDTVRDFITRGACFETALETRAFEPDTPHFTSRISGLLRTDGTYQLSILKSGDDKGSSCERHFFSYESLPGVGHFIHTYQHDGHPLPAFCGEPTRVQIPNDGKTFADALWNSLNPDNKISLYVRFCDWQSGAEEALILNQHGGEA